MAIADRCPACMGVKHEYQDNFQHNSNCVLRFDSPEVVTREGIRKSIFEKMDALTENIETICTPLFRRIRTLRFNLRALRTQIRMIR